MALRSTGTQRLVLVLLAMCMGFLRSSVAASSSGVRNRRAWFPSFGVRKQKQGNATTRTQQEEEEATTSVASLLETSDEHSHPQQNRSSALSNHDVVNSTSSSLDVESLPVWKQELPRMLQKKGPKTLQKLHMGEATEIYLLGTAHVSNDSSADVKLLLEAVDPDCIFVELCEARIALLEGTDSLTAASNDTTARNESSHVEDKEEPESKSKLGFWDKLNKIQQSQGGSRLQALSTLLLTSVQEDYAEALGVELGGEFRAAHRFWMARPHQEPTTTTTPSSSTANAPGIPRKHVSLVLGDRPLSLTLVRAWESLWWWPKTKVMIGLLLSSLQKPNPEEIRAWLESVLRDESDVLTQSLQELQKHFPSLHTTIIAERDAWLSSKLVQTCRIYAEQYHVEKTRQLQETRHSSLPSARRHHHSTVVTPRKRRIVAIVGAGHLPGIVQWLTGNVTTEFSTPEQILANLTATKRWEKDAVVQQEMIPSWIHDVTEVHRHDNTWSWAEPSMAAPT